MPDGIKAAGVGRRDARRLRLVAEARLITRTGTFAVTFKDISTDGAHLLHPLIEPFTWCVIKLRQRELYGHAVWQRGGESGIRFDAALADDDVLALRSAYPEVHEWDKLPVPDNRRRI